MDLRFSLCFHGLINNFFLSLIILRSLDHSVFDHSPTERQLGCFQVLEITAKAAINILDATSCCALPARAPRGIKLHPTLFLHCSLHFPPNDEGEEGTDKGLHQDCITLQGKRTLQKELML